MSTSTALIYNYLIDSFKCTYAYTYSYTYSYIYSTVQYDYEDMSVSTAPIYNYLIDGGNDIDILVYSGDDDSVCGTIGTQNWIYDLGYSVSSKWQPYILDGQTAGYLTQFGGN
jgi:hypothetical protein